MYIKWSDKEFIMNATLPTFDAGGGVPERGGGGGASAVPGAARWLRLTLHIACQRPHTSRVSAPTHLPRVSEPFVRANLVRAFIML